MPLQKAEALFDFKPTASVELELKKGGIVTVRRMSVGEGWWEGEIDGKRGLFPSSFVKLLSAKECASPERAKTPLTPRTSKKAFMETLLSPAHSTQDLTYDVDKAAELYVPGHTNMTITVGPRWDCKPPELTVVITDLQTESRFSGMKHTTLYQVETQELGAIVTRKHKHFLWLYDRLAENFPCISLPPLPVKHLSASEGVEVKRKALEKFLNRVARHPLLASTKLFRDFLLQKDDRDWKIGRHSSHIRMPKSAKKLFNAPVYATIRYPPYNVPLHQLASIERFSRFSRTLEMNMAALQQSYSQLGMLHGEAMAGVNMLGREMQRFARGLQQPPTTAASGFQRRKLAGVSSVQQLGITVATNGQATHHHAPSLLAQRGTTPTHLLQRGGTVPGDIDEEDSGDETDCSAWNWRDDSRFDHMVKDLHDLATDVRHTSHTYSRYQTGLERVVLSTLEDYSGIIHTLPILVKLHEDAMEAFNYSKEKDSKKEAEEVRQNCETLNNILLAEFDYFSEVMVDDFEEMMSSFLLEQANLHRQLAEEWEGLHETYAEKRSHRTNSTGSRKRAHSSPHYSYSPAYSSSPESSATSIPENRDSKSSTGSHKSSLTKSLSAATASMTTTSSSTTPASGPMGIPMYINVQPMAPSKEESDSDIDEDLLCSKKKSEMASSPLDHAGDGGTDTMDGWAESVLNDTLMEHDFSVLEDSKLSKTHDYAVLEDSTEIFSGEDAPPHPQYANMEYLVKSGSVSSCSSPPASGEGVSFFKKLPKKPMPMQRKVTKDGPSQQQEGDKAKQHSDDTPKTAPSASISIPKRPLAPPQVQKPSSSSSSVQRPISPRPYSTAPSYQTTKVTNDSTNRSANNTRVPGGGGGGGGGVRTSPETGEPEDVASTVNGVELVVGSKKAQTPPIKALPTTAQQYHHHHHHEGMKPRSYTTVDQRKLPLLPRPAKPNLKSPSSSPQLPRAKTPEAATLTETTTVENVDGHRISRERTQEQRNKQSSSSSSSQQQQPVLRPPQVMRSISQQQQQQQQSVKPNTDTPTGREELMRKLSLRRLQIEQQLGFTSPNSSGNAKDNSTGGSSILTEASSSTRTSTSSSQSEVVVAYKKIEDALSLSSNGGVVPLRKQQQQQQQQGEGGEEGGGDLSKYGILEDKEGGSFLI